MVAGWPVKRERECGVGAENVEWVVWKMCGAGDPVDTHQWLASTPPHARRCMCATLLPPSSDHRSSPPAHAEHSSTQHHSLSLSAPTLDLRSSTPAHAEHSSVVAQSHTWKDKTRAFPTTYMHRPIFSSTQVCMDGFTLFPGMDEFTLSGCERRRGWSEERGELGKGAWRRWGRERDGIYHL